MKRISILGATLLLAAAPLAAQTTSPYYLQGLLGPTSRSGGSLTTGNLNGISLLGRGGYRVDRHLGLIGELSLDRYNSEDVGFACPVLEPGCGILSAAQIDAQTAGLTVMGIAIGVQPTVQLGPLSLMASGTVGGYAPFKSVQTFAGARAGLRASLTLGLPIGDHFHALLEAGQVHFLNRTSSQADGRRYSIGVAVE